MRDSIIFLAGVLTGWFLVFWVLPLVGYYWWKFTRDSGGEK